MQMETRDLGLARKLPTPKGNWLLGQLWERQNDPLGMLERTFRNGGDFVHLRMGPRHIYVLNHPDLIKQVFHDDASHFIKGFGYDKLEPILGKGLLTSEGEFWRRQRKLAQPAFHRQRLEGYARVMTEFTEKKIQEWGRTGGSDILSIGREMMKLTLGIVGKTLLGTDVAGEADRIGPIVTALTVEANFRITSLNPLRGKLPTPANRRFKQQALVLKELVLGIIREKRASGQDTGDLLSMLILAKDADTHEQMTDQQLLDEVMTIFLAGHETTANALSWIWVLLSQNPSEEKKLHDELDRVLGGRIPTFADLPALSYVKQVVEEALRVYPPAWLISREVVTPVKLRGYEVVPGEIMIIAPWILHRHPAYWKDPEVFRPERFAEEGEASLVPKYGYIPFGGGARVCIGNQFALMEMQLVVATIAQKFRLRLSAGQSLKPEPMITLRPPEGLKMEVIRRG